MPLIVLGLIVIIGIVIYALVKRGQSEEEDTRTVRERYPHVFEKFDKMKNKGANYTVVEDDEEDDKESGSNGEGHTMYFPTDAEVEKRKRNIR